MDKVKIGVIGLGGVAQLVHLPNLTKMRNIELTAVAETNKSRLNTIADKFNVKINIQITLTCLRKIMLML